MHEDVEDNLDDPENTPPHSPVERAVHVIGNMILMAIVFGSFIALAVLAGGPTP